MKRNKVATSVTSGRAKVDRAETYPGGVKDETGADGAQKADYRRYNSSVPRVGNSNSGNSNSSGNSSASGGNNVMKWFKYITDAAESYKSKDGAKSKKPVHQPTVEAQSSGGRGAEGGAGGVGGGGGGAGGGGRSPLYETTKLVANGSRREEIGDGENRHGEDGAGGGYIIHQQYQQQQQQQHPAGHAWRRVEALQFEEDPVLVQPDEVKVSLTKVVDRPSDTTTTTTTTTTMMTPMSPIDMIKEKNRVIEVTMAEKRNLVANILQIPFQSYDHICEVVDETRTSTDVRELMLSSLTQADLLTQLINDQLDAKLSLREGSDEPRGTLTTFETEGSVRSPTRASLSRSVAIDQNPCTEGNQQLDDERLDLKSCPDDRQTTLRAVEGELPIVVPCSQLMAISNRLRSNLTQLMELVESQDREMASWETELSQCNDHPRHPKSQRHRGNGEYVTSSWEAAPVETEHLEVIEAEPIIEPERVVALAPNLLPGSVTVTRMPGAKNMMPSASGTNRHDS